MKTCIHCHEHKQLSDFVKSDQCLDGHLNQCKLCHNAIGRKRYHASWTKQQSRRNAKHIKLKMDALLFYGRICGCCGEDEQSFLTIDHVCNDGAEHRKQRGVGSGHNFYQWLKNNKYPAGFQVLCMNCNFSKYTNGGSCVHQEQR